MKNFLIIALLLSFSGLASAANLVQNGSFEVPIQQNGTFSIKSSIPGWNLASGSGIEIRNNNVGIASNGVNFVELDANSNSAIQQNITTSAGGLYELLFDYSPRIGQPAITNGISVFWNDNLLSEITAAGGSTNLWLAHQFLVTGTGNDVLKFAATGRSDSLGGNIDDVRLNAAVPIPAAIWLMASGLGLLGLVPRRKSL